MAIKLNGVEITSNKLNSSNVTLENLDGVKVFPTAVPATGWAMVGASSNYIASFEQTEFFIDPLAIGCGFDTTHLPSASQYLVGDIVRGRLNSSGLECNTWVYYEATLTLKWQFVAYHSSEPDNYDLLLDWNINGDYEQGINHLNTNFPAGIYNEGFVAVILDETTDNYYEYVVVFS